MRVHLRQAYRGGYLGRPGWWLHFDYDEDVIAAIKAYPIGTARAWDDGQKRWWISEGIAEEVAAILPALQSYLRQKALL